jgi:ABC-type sugar transport system permease subunit
VPALGVLGVFRVWPMIEAVRLSFTNWNGLSPPVGVGWANYSRALHDQQFISAIEHNVLVLLALPVWVLLPFLLATALHSGVPGWRAFRLIFFLPAVLSPVVLGLYYGIVLRPTGPVNGFLNDIGLSFLTHSWLESTNWALFTVTAIIVWYTFGIGVLIFLSALSAIDTEQLEAARMDGASWRQIQQHVVFWQLKATFEFWTVVVTIFSFTALFPLIFALTTGGPGTATYTGDYDVYQEAFQNGYLGYASALGVILLVLLVVIAGLILVVRRVRTLATA